MKSTFLHRTLIALILITPFSYSFAQTIEKKTYQTAFTKTVPEIDGLMNDSCWNAMEWKGDFIQIPSRLRLREPKVMKPLPRMGTTGMKVGTRYGTLKPPSTIKAGVPK